MGTVAAAPALQKEKSVQEQDNQDNQIVDRDDPDSAPTGRSTN